MANIVYLDGIDPIAGSRQGVTFDKAQAGKYCKKRPSPINRQTTAKMQNQSDLKDANTFFWALSAAQKNLWRIFAANSGITGPYGMTGTQQACAGFFACALNAKKAGDGFPLVPGPPTPLVGVTFTALTWINQDTVRATFTPSPAGANTRIFLRQALPGPGIRRWSKVDGYIAEYSAKNPNSTFDFTTKFQHLNGWYGRYWLGTQNTFGGRSTEALFDL